MVTLLVSLAKKRVMACWGQSKTTRSSEGAWGQSETTRSSEGAWGQSKTTRSSGGAWGQSNMAKIKAPPTNDEKDKMKAKAKVIRQNKLGKSKGDWEKEVRKTVQKIWSENRLRILQPNEPNGIECQLCIGFSGPSGTGKTVHAERLAELLLERGFTVVLVETSLYRINSRFVVDGDILDPDCETHFENDLEQELETLVKGQNAITIVCHCHSGKSSYQSIQNVLGLSDEQYLIFSLCNENDNVQTLINRVLERKFEDMELHKSTLMGTNTFQGHDGSFSYGLDDRQISRMIRSKHISCLNFTRKNGLSQVPEQWVTGDDCGENTDQEAVFAWIWDQVQERLAS